MSLAMKILSTAKRVSVVAALVEGNNINACCRMTGVAKHTVLKLLKELGCACSEYHEKHVRNLHVRRVQCDKIWAFVYASKITSPKSR
jgi:Holliday junction resolvasome RuvABC DNA-binding subunit